MLAAAATVPTLLTAVASSCGSVQQKGTVLGIFRSLGALARAFGPLAASLGERYIASSGLARLSAVEWDGTVVSIIYKYQLSQMNPRDAPCQLKSYQLLRRPICSSKILKLTQAATLYSAAYICLHICILHSHSLALNLSQTKLGVRSTGVQ